MISIAAMALSVFYNVFMRYFFNHPTLWAEDVNSYLVVLLTCFGAAEVMKRGEHIKFDLFSVRSTEKVSIIVEFFLLFFALFWCSFITWKASVLATNCYRYGMREPSPLETPLLIPYSILVIGLVLLGLQFLVLLTKNFLILFLKKDAGGIEWK